MKECLPKTVEKFYQDAEQREEKNYQLATNRNVKTQGFSKSERVKSKNDFEKVFSLGKTIHSSDKRFKATYFFDKTNERGLVKAAFAVHKRAGKAVWRNRVKRLLRDSFRLNKHFLYDAIDLAGRNLIVVFSPNTVNEKKTKKLSLNDVMPSVVDLMSKIVDYQL